MNKELLYLKFENDMRKRNRALRLLLAIDQFFNVLIWNGSQDETISSHIHRRQAAGKSNRAEDLLCKVLKAIENNHCLKSLGE